MWAFKDHGKSWEAVYEREHPPGFRWLHESFGTNWRMTRDAGGDRPHPAAEDASVDRSEERQREAHPRCAFAARAMMMGPIASPPVRHVESGADVHAYYRYYCYVRPENLARRMGPRQDCGRNHRVRRALPPRLLFRDLPGEGVRGVRPRAGAAFAGRDGARRN